MAGNNLFNDKDSMDISDLAALNNDISDDLIEQLQQKVAQEATNLTTSASVPLNENDDATLFEEPNATPEIQLPEQTEEAQTKEVKIQENYNDSFMEKYKAKLNKPAVETGTENEKNEISPENTTEVQPEASVSPKEPPLPEPIEKVSSGNITEKAITKEQKDYNDSLDFLDGNVKYSKYVIYIDPKNVDFIESLTVKERKNLINNILRQQDDISITKQRFSVINNVIRHVIVAILTVSISIPVIYYVINASLEASINNYRRSQSNFQTLYKENGKITKN